MITDDQRRRELVASLEARIVRILDLSQLVPRPSVWYVPVGPLCHDALEIAFAGCTIEIVPALGEMIEIE
jgi:hypothetical protein